MEKGLFEASSATQARLPMYVVHAEPSDHVYYSAVAAKTVGVSDGFRIASPTPVPVEDQAHTCADDGKSQQIIRNSATTIQTRNDAALTPGPRLGLALPRTGGGCSPGLAAHTKQSPYFLGNRKKAWADPSTLSTPQNRRSAVVTAPRCRKGGLSLVRCLMAYGRMYT